MASATRAGSSGAGATGLAGVDEAEAARPRAAVAEHHERGRAVGPALRQVRATGVLAHRDEPEGADRVLERHHRGVVAHLRAQPRRLARPDRRARRRRPAASSRDRRRTGWAIGAGGWASPPSATSRPGPAPRENGARSSGRCRHATSWRSARPLPHRSPARRATHVDDVAPSSTSTPSSAQRRHRAVGDAAGDDVLAHVRQVGRDVEGEAVHRAPVLEAHADGADLARVRPVGVDPHARVLGQSAGVDAEGRQRVDDELLDVAHVLGRAERVGDRQDRIADELARAVVRDVAAAAHGDEVGADRGRIAAQVGWRGRTRGP